MPSDNELTGTRFLGTHVMEIALKLKMSNKLNMVQDDSCCNLGLS